MAFLIIKLRSKIILELKENLSLFFCSNFVAKEPAKIPENLELDMRTKEDFIYFIRTAVLCQFFSGWKCLEKRFCAAKLKNKDKHIHQILKLLFVSNSFLFRLFCLHSEIICPQTTPILRNDLVKDRPYLILGIVLGKSAPSLAGFDQYF